LAQEIELRIAVVPPRPAFLDEKTRDALMWASVCRALRMTRARLPASQRTVGRRGRRGRKREGCGEVSAPFCGAGRRGERFRLADDDGITLIDQVPPMIGEHLEDRPISNREDQVALAIHLARAVRAQ
jgi:hypothetical protein